MDKLAVISDIHGNRWALEAVLADISARGITRTVNLGDCLYGPLDPAGTADILIELDLPTVRGNEDRIINDPDGRPDTSQTLEYVRAELSPNHIDWLRNLPFCLTVTDDCFLCHAGPDRDDGYLLYEVGPDGVTMKSDLRLQEETARIPQPVILCGHSHVPGLMLLPDGKIIIDAGSVGLQAYTDDRPYRHRMQAGSPEARYTIITGLGDKRQVETIRVAYHHETAAAAAEKNGRHDWATWLRTGTAENPDYQGE